jgi:hypothetical protein
MITLDEMIIEIEGFFKDYNILDEEELELLYCGDKEIIENCKDNYRKNKEKN